MALPLRKSASDVAYIVFYSALMLIGCVSVTSCNICQNRFTAEKFRRPVDPSYVSSELLVLRQFVFSGKFDYEGIRSESRKLSEEVFNSDFEGKSKTLYPEEDFIPEAIMALNPASVVVRKDRVRIYLPDEIFWVSVVVGCDPDFHRKRKGTHLMLEEVAPGIWYEEVDTYWL